MNKKIAEGKAGEDIAELYLRKKGYKIIAKNFKIHYGEIDIIALDKNVLVFVEVKTRKSSQFGTPLEAITPWKILSITKTGQYYVMTHKNLPQSLRIDAVGIKLSDQGEVEDIELAQNITG